STTGARMNTARTGPPSSPSTARSASKESTWRPNALRRTAMSIAPKQRWSGRPSSTSAPRRIMPAQVPRAGRPSARRRASGSVSPARSSCIAIVVDSPPGTTSASTSARSSGVRTSRASAPRLASALACAANAPCRARTPTFTWGPRCDAHGSVDPIRAARPAPRQAGARRGSPAAVGEGLLEAADLEAGHRPAEPTGHLGDDRRVLVVGGGLHDRLGPAGRIVRLEDPRADEDGLGAELHHERSVGGGGDATGAEQRDGQLAGLGDLLNERQRGLEPLGPVEQLGGVGLGDLADVPEDRAQVADGLDDVAGAGLPLRADHAGTLADAPKGLTEVGGPAHERHGERPLVDVVGLVGRG